MSTDQHGVKPIQHQDEPPSITNRASQDSSPLSDAELQEQYRKDYIEQLKRMSCPGCGEDPPLF